MGVQSFETVRRMVFGSGAVESLPDEIKRVKGSRVFVVTDPGIQSAGVLDLVTGVLERAKIPFSAYAEVEPDPRVEVALASAEAAKASANSGRLPSATHAVAPSGSSPGSSNSS